MRCPALYDNCPRSKECSGGDCRSTLNELNSNNEFKTNFFLVMILKSGIPTTQDQHQNERQERKFDIGFAFLYRQGDKFFYLTSEAKYFARKKT